MRIFIMLLFALLIYSCSSDEKMGSNTLIEGITIGTSINDVDNLNDYQKTINSLNGIDFSVYTKEIDHDAFSEAGILVIDSTIEGIVFIRERDDYFNSDRTMALLENLTDQYGEPTMDAYIDNVERIITFKSDEQSFNTIIVSHSNYSTIEEGPQFVLALMYGTSQMLALNKLFWQQ